MILIELPSSVSSNSYPRKPITSCANLVGSPVGSIEHNNSAVYRSGKVRTQSLQLVMLSSSQSKPRKVSTGCPNRVLDSMNEPLIIPVGGSFLIDYGAILAPSTKSIEVKFYPKEYGVTVTSIYAPSDLGITDISGIAVGDPISDGMVKLISITTDNKLGVTVANNFVSVQLSNGQVFQIQIKAFKVASLLLLQPPDRNSYSESYKYITVISRTLSGEEYRKPLIQVPKWSSQYSLTLNDITSIRGQFFGTVNLVKRVSYNPVWGDILEVLEDADSTRIRVSNLFPELHDFDRAYIMTPNKIELVGLMEINDKDYEKGELVFRSRVKVQKGDLIVPTTKSIATGEITANTNPNEMVYSIQVEEL